MTHDTDLAPYFSGEKLYGDDLSASEIERWFEQEREGYADLGAKDAVSYEYHYHALNRLHCFARLPDRRFPRVLGYGSAYGDELAPIAGRAEQITVVDPSDAFVRETIHGVPARYVKPAPSGDLPFEDGAFDLVCCFGVLHHVPNVSHVVREFARVLAPSGYALLREPIVSMGDWRQPRAGLTQNERGIPEEFMKTAVEKAGLEIVTANRCDFALTPRLFGSIRPDVYNSMAITRIDHVLARMFGWNYRYHARTAAEKLRPASLAIVARSLK